MNSPPARPSIRVLVVCVLLFAAVGTVSIAVGDGPATQGATAAVCDHDDYQPPSLDREWEGSFVDPLENGSLEHWSGGTLARVGGAGDCSLVVAENDAGTLTATTVNGTRGIVTGSVDLGANGSLTMAGANETHTLVRDTVVRDTVVRDSLPPRLVKTRFSKPLPTKDVARSRK